MREETNGVPGYRAARSLACERPENAERALAAFLSGAECLLRSRRAEPADYSAVYEHGQLWIVAIDGAQWSVNDAEGRGSVDGFCFEQVSAGEED